MWSAVACMGRGLGLFAPAVDRSVDGCSFDVFVMMCLARQLHGRDEGQGRWAGLTEPRSSDGRLCKIRLARSTVFNIPNDH